MTETPHENKFHVEFGDDFVTPGEAARYLGVSPKTVTRWAKAGLIPYIVTLGGQRRFRRTDIEDAALRMLAGPE